MKPIFPEDIESYAEAQLDTGIATDLQFDTRENLKNAEVTANVDR